MEEKEKKKEIYSYHTFIFPFLWNNGGKISRKQFECCLNPRWKLDVMDENGDNDKLNQNERKWLYNQYQYFNTAARRILYTYADDQKQIVRNYTFDDVHNVHDEHDEHDKRNKKDVSYCISKKNGNNQTEYKLKINNIRLKLYETGIGLIVYELENTDYTNLADVNKINDFGRRVFMPYYFLHDEKVVGCNICADEIRLKGLSDNEGKNVCTKFTEGEIPKHPHAPLSDIITFLLENGSNGVTVRQNDSSGKFYIEPIIDDRMFTACLITNAEFTSLCGQWNENRKEYKYLSDACELRTDTEDNIAQRLYELVFIDNDGSSCQSRAILHDMLKEHIYDRWTENYSQDEPSNTITGITDYSFVSIIPNHEGYLVDPFLTQYIEMIMLVVAQRASLLAFERQISEVSSAQSGEKELRESYMNFRSRMLLAELTPQQQGMELYQKMLDTFFINAEKNEIDNRIQSLFEFKNYNVEKKQSHWLFFIALIGCVCALDVILQWCGGFVQSFSNVGLQVMKFVLKLISNIVI